MGGAAGAGPGPLSGAAPSLHSIRAEGQFQGSFQSPFQGVAQCPAAGAVQPLALRDPPALRPNGAPEQVPGPLPCPQPPGRSPSPGWDPEQGLRTSGVEDRSLLRQEWQLPSWGCITSGSCPACPTAQARGSQTLCSVTLCAGLIPRDPQVENPWLPPRPLCPGSPGPFASRLVGSMAWGCHHLRHECPAPLPFA